VSTYLSDRLWSDAYLPAVKRIVGPRLLVETPVEIDRQQAADLMVFTARSVTIAVRVRRHGYALRYPTQFTIRCRRDSGMRTEHAKIMDGWGDWYLYGHAAQTVPELTVWWLLDLAVFRQYEHQSRPEFRSNGDGTHFLAYDVSAFPFDLILASSHRAPAARLATA
jgi:hypothetical protein